MVLITGICIKGGMVPFTNSLPAPPPPPHLSAPTTHTSSPLLKKAGQSVPYRVWHLAKSLVLPTSTVRSSVSIWGLIQSLSTMSPVWFGFRGKLCSVGGWGALSTVLRVLLVHATLVHQHSLEGNASWECACLLGMGGKSRINSKQ